MFDPRRFLQLSVALAVCATAACGGDSQASPAIVDATADGAESGGVDGSDAIEQADGQTDAEEDGGEPQVFDIAATFYSCSSDDECPEIAGNPQICVSNVCALPPERQATLSNDEGTAPIDATDIAVQPGCFQDGGLLVPAGEDTYIAVTGKLERFGSGPPTTGLCITIYEEDTLLPWLVNNDCNALVDEEDDAYIGCWQLDPCRCEEHFGDDPNTVNESLVDAANEGLDAADETAFDVEDLNTCFAFIGYCDAINDAGLQTACVDRLRRTSLANSDTLIFGYTRSTDDLEDQALDEPEGTSLFTIDGIPTNTRFAFKVSGRENRWRDTWEYGLFARGDVVADGQFNSNANVVSDGAWRTIPPAVGRANVDDRNGALAGVVRDCGGEGRNPWAIVSATVGIAFSQGSVLAYFNGNPDNRLPAPAQTDTNVLGTFAAIDLPAGPNRVAPIICTGDCSNRENLVLAGGKNVFQTPKSVIIATFEGYFTF
ncbi:MAG: hypothetical protein ACJA1R_000601 [Flavobacteriales bacterium]|jgi:hypothetical protein